MYTYPCPSREEAHTNTLHCVSKNDKNLHGRPAPTAADLRGMKRKREKKKRNETST